ncbi:DUF1631 family protein [Rhodoferax sp.]|uniref:DUF1631 family protein n=1 Tax=Rhodoferax sp. TaxID=50421 RepID=UPI00275FA71D|nr:DUF1631 family protein [Rhodoferax sp.]
MRPTLNACIEVVLEQSDLLINGVLDGLAASTARIASKGSVVEQPSWLKLAIGDLCRQAPAIRSTFAAHLRGAVYNSAARDSAEQPLVTFEDLQILDSREIDANIEFALAQQEVLRSVEDVLPGLNALVSSLLGWITVQAHLNPLRPEAFVRALQACLQAHVAQERERTALITPAAGLMGVGLRQLYKEIGDWLRSQGVEPATPVGMPIAGLGAGKGKGAESSVARTLLTLDRLRKLLSGELNTAFTGAGTQDFLHTVPASFVAMEDLQLVGPMMKRLAQRASSPEAQAGSLAGVSAQHSQVTREPTQSKQLGKQLGEEVIRMMLDNLGRDERLLPQVRDLLQSLEPVLMKLSQVDPRFFSERQHPARMFLDRLTHRSLAYSTVHEEGFQKFLKAATQAVGVLGRGDGDAAAFAYVLKKLENGWKRDDATQHQRQEEAARALLHAEQRNLLAQRLAEDFHQRQEHKDIPELVSGFLRGPWAQVVAESQLRCVDGTSDPDGYLAMVDDLLWSVQARLTRRHRNRLVDMVPGLLVKLRQGLQLIDYPAERIPVFFDALISLHEKAFEGPRQGAQALAADDLHQAPDASEFWVGDHEAGESGYLEDDADMGVEHAAQEASRESGPPRPWTAGDLVAGSWVELLVGGVWLRAQLTWASPHKTLFMFVSQGGLAHSMSRRTMDRLRMRGSIRVVSDGRLIDNALDGVAQSALQNDLTQVDPAP